MVVCPWEVELNTSYNFKRKNYLDLSCIYVLQHSHTRAAYVGKTSNLANRSHAHAEALRGKLDAPWLRKFYCQFDDFMTSRGSWTMYVLEETEALSKQELWWYELIRPILNSHRPSGTHLTLRGQG